MVSDIEKTSSDAQLSLGAGGADNGADNGAGAHKNTDSSSFVGNEADHKSPAGVPDHRREFAEQIAAMSADEYAEMDRRVIRKMDKNIIPWIT
jgi:hypothetical protein